MANLISTAPGAYTNLLGLITTQAQARDTPVAVFPFELDQYEPGSYIIVSGIENHQIEWENIGPGYQQIESYSLIGKVTVFTGGALSDDPAIPTTVLNDTYDAFNACVMEVAMTDGFTVPILGPIPGVADGTLYRMQPEYARYRGQPGNMGGGQSGWAGVIDWSFRLEGYLTRA